MKPAVHHRTTCRLCDSKKLELVLSLTPTPPANAFVSAAQTSQRQETFPLDLFFCQDCFHLQLLDVVDPEILFKDYVYVSGTSPVFVKHFREYADEMTSRFHLNSDSSVFEIGSNDGTLLGMFRDKGMKVLGVDPAEKIAKAASDRGIETLSKLFTSDLAQTLKNTHGQADLIVANNVFAHIDNLKDVVGGVKTMLKSGGAFVFEVSYLVDVLENTLFDTIYHEHLCYHSVMSLQSFFKRNGMELFDVAHVGSHGGSLRGFAQLTGGPHKVSESVAKFIAQEKELGLDQSQTYKKFADKINGLKSELTLTLKKLKQDGKVIAGFGAPAKATTLMYHFGLGKETVDFIVDDSPLKQGLYSPGLHVPVKPASVLKDQHVDYLLILAWNFADPIIQKNQEFVNRGGHFIVPVPKVRVV